MAGETYVNIAKASEVDNKQSEITINMYSKHYTHKFKNNKDISNVIMSMYSVVMMCKYLKHKRENE